MAALLLDLAWFNSSRFLSELRLQAWGHSGICSSHVRMLRKTAKPHHVYRCHIQEGPFLFEQFKLRVIPSLGSASLPLYLLSASNRALFYIYWIAQKWVRNLLFPPPIFFLPAFTREKNLLIPQVALKTAYRCYQPKFTC